MKYFLLVSVFCFNILFATAQKANTVKGYLIYFNYEWIFQPDNKHQFVLDALNDQSNMLILGTDGYNNSIAMVADSLSSFSTINPVFYTMRRDTTPYAGEMKYSYCKIVYKTDTLHKMSPLDKCIFTLQIKDKTYPLGCKYDYIHVDEVYLLR